MPSATAGRCIHLNRLGFELDGAADVRDPKGLAARHLAGAIHAVTADEAPLRNLAPPDRTLLREL